MVWSRTKVFEALSEQMELEKKKQPLCDALKLLESYHGGLWIVGGFVSQALVYNIYDRKRQNADLDILLQEPYDVHNLELEGWSKAKTPFGGLRLIKDEMQIDVWPLNETFRLKERNLEFTLDNYLKTVPFNIQSIAYGPYSGAIFGETGIEALCKMNIMVNDKEAAESYAQNLGISVEGLMKQKANKLGFGYIY